MSLAYCLATPVKDLTSFQISDSGWTSGFSGDARAPEPWPIQPLKIMANNILVTGDVIRDIYVYQGDREYPAQPGSIPPYFSDQLGGARCLFELIAAASGHKVSWGFQKQIERKSLQAVHTLWVACEGGTQKDHEDAGKDEKPKKVWRVSNSLGYALGSQKVVPDRSPSAGERHRVLVIDDAGLAFRTLPAKSSWPVGIQRCEESQPDWIIQKTGSPIAQGDLWRALVGGTSDSAAETRRKNLVVIVAADELRRAGAAISRGFSWERTLSELCSVLEEDPLFQPLLGFPQHLIVNFGCVGAVWFNSCHCEKSPDFSAADRATLVYDPTLPEGGWKTRLACAKPVYGHLNTFTTAITLAFDALSKTQRPAEQIDSLIGRILPAAIGRGLAACRELRLQGHGPVKDASPHLPVDRIAGLLRVPSMPADDHERHELPAEFHLVAKTSGRSKPLGEASWTLAAFAENPPQKPTLPLYGLAHRVAIYGNGALRHIPHAHFGKMLSVDRREIETLRSITKLIQRYQNEDRPKQPLSIAAFGPPGAGKSFGIKEIAKGVLGEKVPILEFNLSQFDSASGLLGAYHQVRDQVLKGFIPVVFWDEFDSQNYKWLQYLLAPMQDGVFEENGRTHTIGKCVFVFAGATSWDFDHFGPAPMPETGEEFATAAITARYDGHEDIKHVEQAANDDFRRKKGPDFLSRLDAHIDVLGPNQRMLYNWSTRLWDTPDEHDITFPVRRSLLLRQFLGAKKPSDHLAIDRDLLRAFIQVPRYRYGARSLEKIALHLAKASRKPFCRSDLPPPQVLAHHLDTDADFERAYHQYTSFFTAGNLEKIAAAISEVIAAAIDENYERLTDHHKSEDAKAEGRSCSPRVPLSESEFLAAFRSKAASSDSWQQWLTATNRAAAQRLPALLDLAGLCLVEGAADPPEAVQISAHLIHHLPVLAEEEHNLWLAFHLDNGWHQASADQLASLEHLEQTDHEACEKEKIRLKKEERIHTMLIPFKELMPKEQTKDHDSIAHLPEMAALVGWRVRFVGS